MSGTKGMKGTKQTSIPAKYSEDFLASLDGRVRIVRALKGKLTTLTHDLGGNLSYQQHSLCKRAIHIEAQIESWEQDLINGKDVPYGSYFNSVNSLVNIFKSLGLYRKTKEISLQEYLSANNEDKK